jgi:hypothetical protein
MNLIWLLRMKRWVQNPPSPARMKLILGVIVVCLLVYGAEQIWGWPDWLTVNRIRP